MQPEFIPPTVNQSKSRISGKVMLVIGVILVLLIIGAVIVIAMSSKNPTASLDKLTARMESLTAYTAQAAKSARFDNVRKFNSDAGILLNGDAGSIKKAAAAVGAKGANKAVIDAEKSERSKILDALKKAEIDGRFDREYVKIIESSLTNTQALLAQVNAETSKKTMKSATKTSHDHIATLLESLRALEL